MSIKSILAIPFAKQVKKRVNKWAYQPHKTQEKVFQQLIAKAKNTAFGLDHDFNRVKTYQDFKDRVPVSDYEGLRAYIDRIIAGEKRLVERKTPLFCKNLRHHIWR